MSAKADYLWDPSHETDPEIARLEEALRPYRHTPAPLALDRPITLSAGLRRRGLQLAPSIAAAALVLLAGGAWAAWRLVQPAPWTLVALTGAPRVFPAPASAYEAGAGASVETDARSSARLSVGRIGVLDMEPSSRVEVLRDDDGQHRLALKYGTIHVNVWAPPRFFVVETRSATAVDLGCVYTLRVWPGGAGILAVGFGEVELQALGRRSLVPAGTAARLSPNGGPGLPYPVSSSSLFRRAVSALETAGGVDDAALDTVLREVDRQGTVTLWHLLSRVDPARRVRVYERLAAIAPPPSGVGREDVLALDSSALARWSENLRPLWWSERSTGWRRVLLQLGIAKPRALLDVRRAIEEAKDEL